MKASTSARKVAHSTALKAFARWGLAGRGVLYMLLGVLTVAVALGKSGHSDDQQGALSALAQHAIGKVAMVPIIIGLFGYGVWRLSEVFIGAARDRQSLWHRIESGGGACAYLGLGVSAVSILLHSGRNGSASDRQRTFSAALLANGAGRALLLAIGLVVLGVGIGLVVSGARRDFMGALRVSAMKARERRVVERLGIVGICSRGVAFGFVGAFVAYAAVARDPDKAGGLDAALRTLAGAPSGRGLLILVALGFMIFGAFGLAEARWHKT